MKDTNTDATYETWLSKFWGYANGMTLRDYFAAKAMQAILHDSEVFWAGAASLAYQYADAMLKARDVQT